MGELQDQLTEPNSSRPKVSVCSANRWKICRFHQPKTSNWRQTKICTGFCIFPPNAFCLCSEHPSLSSFIPYWDVNLYPSAGSSHLKQCLCTKWPPWWGRWTLCWTVCMVSMLLPVVSASQTIHHHLPQCLTPCSSSELIINYRLP